VSLNVSYTQPADDILDKAAATLGYKKQKNIDSMLISRVVYLDSGIEARTKTYYKGDDKVLIKTKIKQNSVDIETTQGCKEDYCYTSDSLMGLRLIDGQEKEMLLSQNYWTDWRNLYTKSKFIGYETIENKKTYKLKLHSESGMEVINYYDVENYLLIKSDVTTSTDLGKFTTQSIFREYNKIGNGIIMAKRVVSNIDDKTVITVLENVELNMEIPDDIFNLPIQIKYSEK
jgi:hypothetical protein